MLKDKKIVLGVTGSIAAYKAAELTRELVKRGAAVKVIMTRNASEFIAPLTFQTLSGNPVYVEMFSTISDYDMAHISLAAYADIVVIAPATANIIGKVTSGLADDLLSTTAMTTRAPVLFCPAMNTNMYDSIIVQENIDRLKSRGYVLMEPGYGELACSSEGRGRLPNLDDIVEEIESILTVKDLCDQRLLVTAGPTRESLDPIRFITNHSSGKMGYALAIAAKRRGAEVVLISGPSSLPVPRGITFISVSSAIDMRDAVMKHFGSATVIIKSAAVSDYRPANISTSKIKKKEGPMTLTLERNPDIIAEIGRMKEDRILVGFAAETENLMEYAREKLMKKNMDLIVANDVTEAGAGFGYDTNIIKIIDRNGQKQELPLMDKIDAANKILDRIKDISRNQHGSSNGQ